MTTRNSRNMTDKMQILNQINVKRASKKPQSSNGSMRIMYNILVAISICLSFFFSVVISTASSSTSSRKFSVSLPNVRPDHSDQYLCTAARLPVDLNGQFITGIKPRGDSQRVHHMLLYGCPYPGIHQRDTPNYVWDCSGMHASTSDSADGEESTYKQGPICQGEPQILYGWALDAPALKLPDDVGFRVGGLDTSIHFLVVQVHYGHSHAFNQNPDLTDNSGLILDLKSNIPESGITKQAGVLLLASLGEVKQNKSRHEIYCDIKDDIEIHPLKYRVHTHKLGTEVLGAKLTNHWVSPWASNILSEQNIEDSRIIGKGDPQKPQMFYPVKEKNMTIKKGDTVYAYCEFNNNRSHIVNIGQTGDDEMCNFYLMYWTDSPKLLSKSNCYQVNRAYDFNPMSKAALWG